MKLNILTNRCIGERSPMIYGHFIEHFHRQIYGGIYDPCNSLSDDDGFRTDVINAMKRIKVPILRWPGGCFVSSYHWKDAVGSDRRPFFDKAWRVEDPNSFGTDEFIKMCRKIGCEPYICTNAGTGTAEEMSDWVEYCNLTDEGKYAKERIMNGYTEPHNVKFWSIGNENYGFWEMGAKEAADWGRLTLESAKMMKRVDPSVELSAAALSDVDWNLSLLKYASPYLDWISIHAYWDGINSTNAYADYDKVMTYTNYLETNILKVKGLLTVLGLESEIKIAFDEWNLRGWYHPNSHIMKQVVNKEDYLYPRDLNDVNSEYTMADAVFTACFLNTCNRHCNIVGMANFAPIVNTRGCIFTHNNGIVLRSTYYVFDMYVNLMGEIVLDSYDEDMPTRNYTQSGQEENVKMIDTVATLRTSDNFLVVSSINKDDKSKHVIDLPVDNKYIAYRVHTLCGNNIYSYNVIE